MDAAAEWIFRFVPKDALATANGQLAISNAPTGHLTPIVH